MKRLFSAAVAAFLLCAGLQVDLEPAHAAASAERCGVERESVKVLADVDAPSIDFTPRTSSVEALRALPVPPDYNRNSARRYEAEKHVVRVSAQLVGWKFEADRDFHIVIAQPGHPDETMIAEPPDPACSTSPKAADFAAVRAQFVKCFGQPARWKKLPPMIVELDGVAYFDPIHGQTGVAPNGIELHPLLSVKTVSGKCAQ